jgi:uncharacterized membrane protein YeaQ/YmgE (transglycosylase-associated protein family)
MTWTITNLVIQIITGMVGGNLAAVLAKEHGFGALGHTIVGLVGGAISGYFLQILAGITANGSVNEPTFVEQAILQGLTGAAAGAILVLIVGFVKHSIDRQRAN